MPFHPLHFLLTNAWTAFLVVIFFEGSVFVHELGHFLAARRCGAKIESFSVGFGPAIWSRRGRDGVDYRLACIPVGGYVLLPQLADLGTSSGFSIEGQIKSDVSRLPPVSYASKMLIFVAGATFNILFAFALACVVWAIGQPESNEFATTRVGYVKPTLDLPDGSQVPSPAAAAGLRAGDRVEAIDGRKVTDWLDLRQTLSTSAGRDPQGQPRAVFRIERDGKLRDVALLPRLAGEDNMRQVGIEPGFALVVYQADAGSLAQRAGLRTGDEIRRLDTTPMLSGVALGEYLYSTRAKAVEAHIRRAGKEITLLIPPRPDMKPTADFGLTFSSGLHLAHPSPFVQIRDEVEMTFRTFWSLLNPHSDIGLSKLSGPIGIVHMLSSAAEAGISTVLTLTILLNVNLAILNLLPVPVLDGGQMVFATIGRLRGRALPVNFIMTVQSVFFVLLFSMIIYVSYFDVRRWQRDTRLDREAAAAEAQPQKP